MDQPARPPDARLLDGGCLCGEVRYRVADRFEYALNCHCSMCRRATGSAFKAFAGIRRTELAITQGQDRLLTFGDAAAHDVRCRSCGSFLYSVVRNGEWLHLALGSLADAPGIRPTAHIFVGSKAPWFEITDGLPQHAEFD